MIDFFAAILQPKEDMLSQIEKDNRSMIEQFERDMGWK